MFSALVMDVLRMDRPVLDLLCDRLPVQRVVEFEAVLSSKLDIKMCSRRLSHQRAVLS